MWLSSESSTSAGWIQLGGNTEGPTLSTLPTSTSTHPLLRCNTHDAPPPMHPCPRWIEGGRAVNGDIYLDDIPISTLGDMHPEQHTLPEFTWNIPVFVCSSICEVWLGSCVLCVKWRRGGINEQIKGIKPSDWTWLWILKQTMFTATSAEPLLCRLFPSIYPTNDPITLAALCFVSP